MLRTRTVLAGLFALTASSALAQAVIVQPAPGATQVITSTTTRVDDPSPAPTGAPADDYVAGSSGIFQQSGNIAYATGGVGDEELAALKAHAGDYNLRVMSAMNDGAYIGKYQFRVLDKSGNAVLDIPADGPYVYAKLPAGSYTVEESTERYGSKTQKVSIGARGARAINFRWAGQAFVPEGYKAKDDNR